jgi:hypothetical protein
LDIRGAVVVYMGKEINLNLEGQQPLYFSVFVFSYDSVANPEYVRPSARQA